MSIRKLSMLTRDISINIEKNILVTSDCLNILDIIIDKQYIIAMYPSQLKIKRSGIQNINRAKCIFFAEIFIIGCTKYSMRYIINNQTNLCD